MAKLTMFNNLTLDGFFTDRDGTTRWAHERAPDDEWNAFSSENASHGGALVFGRVTYDEMASFWPTPEAHRMLPVVAKRMNEMPKYVFSRTLDKAAWSNTTLLKDDPVKEVRKLKKGTGPDLAIMGSGTIVSLLTAARLIDEYQFVINPFILGKGRTLFGDVEDKLNLKMIATRSFKNGNVFLRYQPA